MALPVKQTEAKAGGRYSRLLSFVVAFMFINQWFMIEMEKICTKKIYAQLGFELRIHKCWAPFEDTDYNLDN